MKFNYKENNVIRKGKINFLENEDSFYFEDSILDENDISAILFSDSYIELSVECKTKKVLYLSGLTLKKSWIETTLNKPTYFDGELFIETNEILISGIGYTINSIDGKKIYFDKDKNICAIGNPLINENDIGIQFASNTIAIINPESELKAIYLFL